MRDTWACVGGDELRCMALPRRRPDDVVAIGFFKPAVVPVAPPFVFAVIVDEVSDVVAVGLWLSVERC